MNVVHSNVFQSTLYLHCCVCIWNVLLSIWIDRFWSSSHIIFAFQENWIYCGIWRGLYKNFVQPLYFCPTHLHHHYSNENEKNQLYLLWKVNFFWLIITVTNTHHALNWAVPQLRRWFSIIFVTRPVKVENHNQISLILYWKPPIQLCSGSLHLSSTYHIQNTRVDGGTQRYCVQNRLSFWIWKLYSIYVSVHMLL